MAEDEVIKALNVLKRYGKINSILFWEIEAKKGVNYRVTIFLPDINIMWFDTDALKLHYQFKARDDASAFRMGKDEANAVIEQWRLAKLAVTFL